MKTLLIVRHAKSSWDLSGQSDEERPLNERGKKEAADMAKRLREKDIKVDALVSSTAKRAKKTAKYFAEVYGFDKKDIHITEALYEAPVAAFYSIVESLKDDFKAVALFSHNPGITQFANSLTDVKIDDMPTCSIFAVSIDIKKWSDFEKATKQFLFFDYPKNPLE